MMVRAGVPDVKPIRLRGYKEIAVYLKHWHGIEMREEEVCRWASWNVPLHSRLPVDRPTRRRVYGVPDKLDEWVTRWLARDGRLPEPH